MCLVIQKRKRLNTSNVPTAELKGLFGIFCSRSHTLLLLGNFNADEGTAQLFLTEIGVSSFESTILDNKNPPTEDRQLIPEFPSLPILPLINGDAGIVHILIELDLSFLGVLSSKSNKSGFTTAGEEMASTGFRSEPQEPLL